MSEIQTDLQPISRLTRDLRDAAKTLTDQEARYLVDAYYLIQDNRIATENQLRAMQDEPTALLSWLGTQMRVLENQIKGALDKYSGAHPVGEWLRDQKGIGPVLASGLLAHIDIEKAPTAGHIFAFAGLDPTKTWEKGQKRPWNAQLKTICWKIGEAFVKVSGGENPGRYGLLYKERKEQEAAANERGEYAEQAKAMLEKKRFSKSTEAYKHYSAGRLPPAHIHARAKRWAVKIFLSNLHEVWYERHYGKPAPAPYPFAHLGHAHKIEP